MENNAQKCAVKCKSDPRPDPTSQNRLESDPWPDPTRPDPRMDPIRVHLWSGSRISRLVAIEKYEHPRIRVRRYPLRPRRCGVRRVPFG